MSRVEMSALLAAAFAITVVGTLAFRQLAIRLGITAAPNFRTLHEGLKPRAGGIVFALVFVCACEAVWMWGGLSSRMALALIGGGAVATVFGFADDVLNIGVRWKLFAQMALTAWTLLVFGGSPVDLPISPAWLDAGLAWFALVWLINLYNFMDGIDGMAASGAVFLSVGAALALWLTGHADLVLVLGLLAVSAGGFLLFNWQPSRLFMGDAGSVFLGYVFGVLIVGTVGQSQISMWSWMVLFGYFAVDTTTTTILRVFLTDRWYGEHRSHAYQNLARLHNHRVVVSGVTAYHVVWLLPLVVWSVLTPSLAPVAAACAWLPVILWTWRFGPRLSSA